MSRKAKFAFVDDRARSAPVAPVATVDVSPQASLIERLDKAVIETSHTGDHRRAQDIHTISLRLGELRNVLSDAKGSVPDELTADIEKLIALI